MVPAHDPPTPPVPWVTLEAWHILRSRLRLLVCDEGEGIAPALELAKPLVDALDGILTVLGVAPTRAGRDAREALIERAAAAGWTSPRSACGAATRRADRARGARGAIRLRDRRRWRYRSASRCAAPNLSDELLPRIATPLLLVRGRPRRFERILICTAVGEPGKADIRAGGWLARRLNATVTLLHVMTPGRTMPALVHGHLTRGVATLRELEVQGRPSLREAATPLEGVLAELRHEPYDLIVTGAPPPFARAATRGVAITPMIMRQAGCSILVVPAGTW